jgi:mono/diheme cytochrome c family protein
MWVTRNTGVQIAAVVLTTAIVGVSGAAGADGQSDGWQIADNAATLSSPLTATAEVLSKGRDLYQDKCRRCHGPDGRGNGPDADPDDPPGNLADAGRASRNPDGVMFYKVWNGRSRPRMPAFKTDLSRDEVWAVVQFAKTLRRPGAGGR